MRVPSIVLLMVGLIGLGTLCGCIVVPDRHYAGYVAGPPVA